VGRIALSPDPSLSSIRRGGVLAAPALALVLAIGLAACGSAVSTNDFKGEAHAVAQRISDFQADVTSANEQKLCSEDLSSALRGRLNRAGGGCKQALKRQIGTIDDYEMTVERITVSATTAKALVKSTWSGKQGLATLKLVKEGGTWRVSGVG
jgi:hypothetical protein